MSGRNASITAASHSSAASTARATFRARSRTRPPSARAASNPRWRGDGGKNTKPTASAPASSAASTDSGVFRPQILIRRGMTRSYIVSSRNLYFLKQPVERRGQELGIITSHVVDNLLVDLPVLMHENVSHAPYPRPGYLRCLLR